MTASFDPHSPPTGMNQEEVEKVYNAILAMIQVNKNTLGSVEVKGKAMYHLYDRLVSNNETLLKMANYIFMCNHKVEEDK